MNGEDITLQLTTKEFCVLDYEMLEGGLEPPLPDWYQSALHNLKQKIAYLAVATGDDRHS